MWDESRPAVLAKGMYFPDKARLIRAVKIYSVRECWEMTVRESTTEVYKAVCHRDFMGCHWMLRASKKKSGLWKVVAVDDNGQIFPLAFAICANESEETWMLFLNNLKQHEPYAYHRYCVRHLKANFQKKYPDKALHDLMWMAATEHQQYNFMRHMEAIRQLDPRVYTWLMGHELHIWTLHIAERFVERHGAASALMDRGVQFMPIPMRIFERYRRRAHWHSFLQYDHDRGIFDVKTAIRGHRGNNLQTVNEANRFCSCGKWTIYHMPCAHALKCFQQVGLRETNYIDRQYCVAAYVDTYSRQLQPLGAQHYWPPEPFKMVCNKDYLHKLQVQKRTRIRNQMDVGDTIYVRKCGICSQTGHGRRKCPSGGVRGGSNPAPGASSSNVPNYQGYT
ncbi:uncharacterized protein [Nicotiana sylvestris]|uniref:uncharacterized protein n=1 Tax=Nicotiana sylvestris TaxID=4096 RepID=UPI00388C6514